MKKGLDGVGKVSFNSAEAPFYIGKVPDGLGRISFSSAEAPFYIGKVPDGLHKNSPKKIRIDFFRTISLEKLIY